ncbi:hypothetical protein MMC20_007569 [Loxospora ochrophaea]|nr:hypothetical protein [Loxospora ochrophaea]
MFGWDDAQNAHGQVYGQDGDNYQQPDNQSSFSHELIAGVAENHETAKDILAGFAGAETDKLCETKGMDFYDREKMKRDAQDNAGQLYDQQYNNNNNNY